MKRQTKCSIQQTKFNTPFKEKCADFFAPHVETQLKGTITYRKGLTKLHALFRLEVSCSLYYTFPTSFLPFLHSLLFFDGKILHHFDPFQLLSQTSSQVNNVDQKNPQCQCTQNILEQKSSTINCLLTRVTLVLPYIS